MLTSYEEIFCQEVVKGESLVDAHRVAYPKGNYSDKQRHEEGSKKNKLPKIIQRIAELRAPVIERTQRTLETILDEIDDLKKAGLEKKDLKIALDCLKHEAKLRGFEVDRSDITSGGEPVTMETITLNGKKIDVKMGGNK